MEYTILKKRNTVLFKVNPKLYSLKTIYGACYVFINKVYIFLDGNPKKEIKVSMKGKEKLTGKKLEVLAGEFQNELLNYALREKINRSNKKIRELIFGKALFLGSVESLSPSDGSIDSFEEDPLGIAVPWEDKYGKGKTE